MGAILPCPVTSTIIEREGRHGFRVGVAEMNGWRNKMEDAHIIYMKEGWGFFGVFDGHGGDQCSKYVAKEIRAKLDEMGECPKDDAAVKKLVLDVDANFLATGTESGSTAAMCIVEAPATGSSKYKLRVANAGDSRVLLGKMDGTIVDGGGTQEGLTTDHKPDWPSEEERIKKSGGYVDRSQGVARVNGDLAVSRGFGDAKFKQGGATPEELVVTADPELGTFECEQPDFLVIVCDGVSEGNFPNPEVIKLAATSLTEKSDPGVAAQKVIHMALNQNSKDNITCMIVLFTGTEVEENKVEFHPGPFKAESSEFVTAYKSMAERAGLGLEEAVGMRAEKVQEELDSPETAAPEKEALQNEMSTIKAERWKCPSSNSAPGALDDIMRLLGGAQQAPAETHILRRVKCADLETLRDAVQKHDALKWDDRMEVLSEKEGGVQVDDPSDGTSKVKFERESLVVWLPTDILTEVSEEENP